MCVTDGFLCHCQPADDECFSKIEEGFCPAKDLQCCSSLSQSVGNEYVLVGQILPGGFCRHDQSVSLVCSGGDGNMSRHTISTFM